MWIIGLFVWIVRINGSPPPAQGSTLKHPGSARQEFRRRAHEAPVRISLMASDPLSDEQPVITTSVSIASLTRTEPCDTVQWHITVYPDGGRELRDHAGIIAALCSTWLIELCATNQVIC